MPVPPSRAILMEISAYVADNNIRRGVLTCATNALSTLGAVNDFSVQVPAGATGEGSISVAMIEDNKLTFIRSVGGPVTLTIGIGSNEGTITYPVDSAQLLSSHVATLTLSNPGSTPVQVRILQI